MDDDVVGAALDSLLTGPRHSIPDTLDAVPSRPGLYAIYGDDLAIQALALGHANSPLYVGKAERSLVGRDLRTHFATGKTGSSTLRRTLAALLRDDLGLRAVPRNLARPDGSANYSVDAEGDQRLTDWMTARLRLAVWAGSADAVLDELESAVLNALSPPLNLSKMGARGNARVKAARAAMAAEARAWQAP